LDAAGVVDGGGEQAVDAFQGITSASFSTSGPPN
jgi:hypothetical protein